MGQAKARGSFEQRQASAIARRSAEQAQREQLRLRREQAERERRAALSPEQREREMNAAVWIAATAGVLAGALAPRENPLANRPHWAGGPFLDP